jgi:hypothetical protein
MIGGGTPPAPTFSPSREPGGCGTITVNSVAGTVVPPSGELDLSIAANSVLNMPIVIRSVRIFSIVDARISGAAEVCAGGERSLLSVNDIYSDEDVDYQWYRNNVLIPGATGRTYMHLTGGTGGVNYSYHFTMRIPVAGSSPVTTTSETFTIRDITCCLDEFGNPTSRKLIWQDDFGTFESANSFWRWDYSDISNPKKVSHPTRHNWRTDITHYNIPGGPCAGSPCGKGCMPRQPWALYHPGPIQPGRPCDNFMEGYYMIATRIRGSVNNNPAVADLGWAGAFGNVAGTPYFPDHTYGFDADGGMLLINLNCNANETIYERVLDNLCNTTVTVKCFIGCFISGNNPRIYVRVTETGTGPGTGYPLNQARSATVTAGNPGTAWREVSVQLTLEHTRSLTFEIISEIGGTAVNISGNDFMMDDIQVWACATPTVELFSDPSDYRAIIKSCKGIGFEMFVDESPMLLNYYGDQLGYIYQYNMQDPDDANFKTSWVNINNTPVSTTSITGLESIFTAFKEHLAATGRSEEGAKLYFRVVGGRRLSLEDAIAKGIPFNPDDPCKEVSIAEPVIVELDCSCPTPRRVNITANKPISNRVVTLCDAETVTLGVSPDLLPPSAAYWYESHPGIAVNPPFAGQGLSFNATVSGIPGEIRKFYVRVIDSSEPDVVGCYRYDSISIKIDPAPATNIMTDVCIAEERKNNPNASDQICFRFTSNYANGLLNGGTPVESTFRPFNRLTGGTSIGTDIVIPARAEGSFCVAGNLVGVTQGEDPLYHIYLEDITIVTKEGVLMDGAASDLTTVWGNANQNGSNVNTVRMLLQVTQAVRLQSVDIYVRRDGAGTNTPFTIVPYIIPASGANHATLGTQVNLPSVTSPSYNNTKTRVPISLNNHLLAPGAYYLQH